MAHGTRNANLTSAILRTGFTALSFVTAGFTDTVSAHCPRTTAAILGATVTVFKGVALSIIVATSSVVCDYKLPHHFVILHVMCHDLLNARFQTKPHGP